jgi:hypothetical protein
MSDFSPWYVGLKHEKPLKNREKHEIATKAVKAIITTPKMQEKYATGKQSIKSFDVNVHRGNRYTLRPDDSKAIAKLGNLIAARRRLKFEGE